MSLENGIRLYETSSDFSAFLDAFLDASEVGFELVKSFSESAAAAVNKDLKSSESEGEESAVHEANKRPSMRSATSQVAVRSANSCVQVAWTSDLRAS
jgi:hypothetical protein